MRLLLMGLNHKSAPVELRERLAFGREGIASALTLLRGRFPQAEASILSTCNRVEILVHSPDGSIGPAQVVSFLAQTRNIPAELFADHLYRLEGRQAIRHLFRVISGIDSMVVGEYQIVNQLKQAYEIAHERSVVGPVLHRLFHHAFGVSKRVRSETAIALGKTSVASVAIDVIRGAVSDLSQSRILMVGAGDMARLALEYLDEKDSSQLTVTTRTLNNAKALADVYGGHAAPFDQLDEQLVNADVVITATNCPTAILSRQRVLRAQARRGDRPLLLIDLAVPRNIEHSVIQIPGVALHDVDALGRAVNEHSQRRHAQVQQGETIIDQEIQAFEKWVAEANARPLIEQMVQDVRALAEVELRSAFHRCPDLTERQRDVVSQLAEKLINKLMHPCVRNVREQIAAGSTSTLPDAFHSIRLSFDRRGSGACPRPAQPA